MVSQRDASCDRNLLGDVVSLENTQVTDLDVLFGAFATEITPLEMLKSAASSKIIHSFKSTSIMRFMKNVEKEFVSFVMNN